MIRTRAVMAMLGLVLGVLGSSATAIVPSGGGVAQAAALAHCPASYGLGANSTCVQQWQRGLNQWRFWNGLPGIAEDGIYGSATFNATVNFQSGRGITVTGGVNPQSRGSMINYLSGLCATWGGAPCGITHY